MNLSTQEAIALATQVLEDNKAQEVVCLSTPWASFTDAMIVCHGSSTRHNKTLTNKLRDAFKPTMEKGPYVEGEDGAEWILVDCENIMIHVMQKSARDFYRLEALWSSHHTSA